MSEQTPERLQAFRESNAQRTGSAKPIVAAMAFGVVLGIGGTIAAVCSIGGAAENAVGGLSAEREREIALLYENKDMPEAAIDAYTTYLDRAALSDEERADVSYSVAKIAIDAGDYERALRFLYQAEHLDPDSEVREERSGQIVHCLEKLGRESSLRRELKKQTGPKPNRTSEAGAVVLAEFGNETVTDRDLERKLDEMPESVRDAYSNTDKRTELLKSLVAERLLLDKAFRLKLDEDEELQARIKEMHDSLLVRKLMENEVNEKLAITPEDVERYYKADPERFTQRAAAKVLAANADTEAQAAAITEFQGQPLTVHEGEPLRGLPNSADVVAVIFGADIGAVTKPIAINDRYFVFKVVEKTPERVAPFEEVNARAEQMLRAEKEQELVTLLIEETLRTRNVKLYPERLEAKQAP